MAKLRLREVTDICPTNSIVPCPKYHIYTASSGSSFIHPIFGPHQESAVMISIGQRKIPRFLKFSELPVATQQMGGEADSKAGSHWTRGSPAVLAGSASSPVRWRGGLDGSVSGGLWVSVLEGLRLVQGNKRTAAIWAQGFQLRNVPQKAAPPISLAFLFLLPDREFSGSTAKTTDRATGLTNASPSASLSLCLSSSARALPRRLPPSSTQGLHSHL